MPKPQVAQVVQRQVLLLPSSLLLAVEWPLQALPQAAVVVQARSAPAVLQVAPAALPVAPALVATAACRLVVCRLVP